MRDLALPIGLLSTLFLFLFMMSSTTASADYTPSYGTDSGYGYSSLPYSPQSSSGPIISLELDAQKVLEVDMRVAAREDRVQDLASFLRQGADVNSKSEEGVTALMYASRNCAIESTEELLKRHADTAERDSHGRTALFYAVMDSCLPVVQMLLKTSRAGLLARDDSHRSVLDYAREAISLDVDGPSIEILRLLGEKSRAVR